MKRVICSTSDGDFALEVKTLSGRWVTADNSADDPAVAYVMARQHLIDRMLKGGTVVLLAPDTLESEFRFNKLLKEAPMSVQEIPTRLSIADDNKHELQKWDVYFDGKKQTQCVVADAGKGFIERYKSLFGVRIARGGRPIMETLYGRVVIVPAGQALTAPAEDGEAT